MCKWSNSRVYPALINHPDLDGERNFSRIRRKKRTFFSLCPFGGKWVRVAVVALMHPDLR